jgi:hypothetical protein
MRKPYEGVTRGRIGQVDALPAEADEIVLWAQEQVKLRRLSKKKIVAAFNERLAAIGCDVVIGRSTFDRWANNGLTEGFAPRAAKPAATAGMAVCCPNCGIELVAVLARKSAP